MIKIFTVAHVPPDLQKKWLQHLRDFDTAHPGCHFQVLADAPDMTTAEVINMLKIEPGLTFEQFFDRRKPSWKNWLRRLFRKPEARLFCWRLADMQRVHPLQITAHCSLCGEEVGVYPSGQQAMREHPGIKLICQVCQMPGADAQLAPGARLEAFQSRWKQ